MNKQAVIFDLGGVLVSEAEVNLHKTKSENLQKVLAGNVPKIRIFNRSFGFASLFCGLNCKSDWILGDISGEEIVSKIKENIDKPEYADFFKDTYEKDIIKHGIASILLPDLLIDLSEIIQEGFEFIKKCKSNNIQISIISNWDPASFILLQSKIPELLNLFEKNLIVIPQLVGNVKPAWEIYDYTVKAINLPLESCYFIDDSQANVEGAQKYGIKSIHHKNWKETEHELIKLGLDLRSNT